MKIKYSTEHIRALETVARVCVLNTDLENKLKASEEKNKELQTKLDKISEILKVYGL